MLRRLSASLMTLPFAGRLAASECLPIEPKQSSQRDTVLIRTDRILDWGASWLDKSHVKNLSFAYSYGKKPELIYVVPENKGKNWRVIYGHEIVAAAHRAKLKHLRAVILPSYFEGRFDNPREMVDYKTAPKDWVSAYVSDMRGARALDEFILHRLRLWKAA
jgi:hypothetical protein